MITLSDKLKAAAWKTYYRFKLKTGYASAMKSASGMSIYLAEQNNSGIGIGRNYNIRGEQIRGWHRPTPRTLRAADHPLIAKYKS